MERLPQDFDQLWQREIEAYKALPSDNHEETVPSPLLAALLSPSDSGLLRAGRPLSSMGCLYPKCYPSTDPVEEHFIGKMVAALATGAKPC